MNNMSPAAIAALILTPFIIWRMVRTILAFRGDRRRQSRDYALQFFTADDIDTGKRSTQPYFLPRLIGYVVQLAFLWLTVFGGLGIVLEKFAVETTRLLVVQALLFALALDLLNTLVMAPLSYHSGYVLGKRLGSLKQNRREWLWFQAKGLSLGILLTWFILWLFQLIVRRYPGVWWLPVAAAFSLLTVLMVFLQPVVLAPLFYKFSRLESGQLRERLLELCRRADISVNDVYVQHESKITTHSNAYFTGIGRTKRIVLYDNLLNTYTEDEAAGIVAHEAGHWKHKHLLVSIVLSTLTIFAGAYFVFHLFRLETAQEFFGVDIESFVIIPAVSLLGLLAGTFFEPAAALLSRTMERQADRTSLELTGDARAFISTQVRLVRDNKADVLPNPLLVRLYASHPPALERIRFAEQKAGEIDVDFSEKKV